MLSTATPIPAGRVFVDWPDIEIPACLRGGDWADASYRHDVMPHCEMTLAGTDFPRLEAWVSPADPAQREAPDFPHFGLHRYADESAVKLYAPEILYEGEDETAFAAACTAAVAALNAGNASA